MQDIFHWRVYLDEGGAEPVCVDEYDAAYPTGRGFGLLKQDAIVGIELLPQRAPLQTYAIQIPAHVGARPFFIRKRSIQFDPLSGEMLGQSTIHCLGWELPGSVSSYCFIFEDGSALFSSNPNVV